MQSNAIDGIRQAEQDANELLNHAMQEAEHIREAAVAQAADHDRAARLAAAGIVESMLTVSRQQAQFAGDEARKALERELAALEAQALNRRQSAVEQILHLIESR